MNRFLDAHGRTVILGAEIGRGGEGAVHEIPSASDFVAKIYWRPATAEKASKLSFMTKVVNDDLLSFSAWPKTTLHDQPGGSTLGIVIPRIRAREIHNLYGPKDREMCFPDADWRFLVHAAKNAAAAFAKLHRLGVVVGDVNQSGIFVTSQALIHLIDCDSFQLQVNGQILRCTVGVPEFTPPELQAARFDEVVRTPNHDNFGLAVLIFHLLFMGRHPFAGRYSGRGDMPIERAIEQYRFAYSTVNARTLMSPPPSCLRLAEVSPEIARLFEAAFAPGSADHNARPSAGAWYRHLGVLESQLKPCAIDPGHYLVAGGHCPWCRLASERGKDFFVTVTFIAPSRAAEAFSIEQAWNAIEAVGKIIYPLAPRESYSRLEPKTLGSLEDPSRLLRRGAGWIAVCSAATTPAGLLSPAVAIFTLAFTISFTVWWLILWLTRPAHKERRSRRRRLNKSSADLLAAQKKFKAMANDFSLQFAAKREGLEKIRRELEGLSSKKQYEIQQLQDTASERQKEAYLSRCLIRQAVISGIGPARIAMLESYGIEAADDISWSRVEAVPGFGPTLTSTLLAWRASKERDFRYDPAQGVPRAALAAVEANYAQIRMRCERQLRSGPSELRRILEEAKRELGALDQVVADRELSVAQAHCDLTVV